MNSLLSAAPPDQAERNRALDPARSILVQAPAGSGKTDLLTRRFLRVLAEVDDPGQIVAITFTKAAAAEMRHRILSELEKATLVLESEKPSDETSMQALACRALDHSNKHGWNLLDLPTQLRISTIDSFCHALALQQPLLSGVGGNLQIDEQPMKLYRRAARQTLQMVDGSDPAVIASIEKLLLWRDNGWQEMEELLVNMLAQRDRWMHDFVLRSDPDWEAVRRRLELPFARAINAAVSELRTLLDQVPGAIDEAHELARFACASSSGELHLDLVELAEFPCGPFVDGEALEEARRAYVCLAQLLLTADGTFRKRVDINLGFPPGCKQEKLRILGLIAELEAIPGLASALERMHSLPPAHYVDEDWRIVQACFTLLRQAAGHLRAVFAEAGSVDFIEVAQIAQQVLTDGDESPTDIAMAAADDIRHLLVDEFQDTSRRQHQLLASLVASWSDQSGRTLFLVGDPMQSIYSFRDADAELFARVRDRGLELTDNEQLILDSLKLRANFRTEASLVNGLNDAFLHVFDRDDGSGVTFTPTEPARNSSIDSQSRLQLHLEFMPQIGRGRSSDPEAFREKKEAAKQCETAQAAQVAEIVALIRSHSQRIENARMQGKKYRVAVLGRTRTSLTPISQALRAAGIPFRALDLENLKDRPEILDALSLTRALLNPQDRVAWLGVLRGPWSGLSLEELHIVAGDSVSTSPVLPIPQLLRERLHQLTEHSRIASERVLSALESASRVRAALPTASLGTLIQQIWVALGGQYCVDASAHANLELFWKLLDRLPEGEQDLLGPSLNSALETLCALPDPAASGDCGVQLMTIHKSKGLEFEVVIVPELQAGTGHTGRALLSWLERGLTDPDESGDITEFLVAPLASKGAERSGTKAWVDRIRHEREKQETRRILYVAATRARDELHLFARPAYKSESNGSRTLVGPSNCLLATAWPALEDEIRTRFDDWRSTEEQSGRREEEIVPSLAASGQSNLIIMPTPPKPTLLRRLSSDFLSTFSLPAQPYSSLEMGGPIGTVQENPYQRHEGGLISRALGNAVHKLLEELARLRATSDWNAARAALPELRPRIVAQIRATGLPTAQADSISDKAYEYARNTSQDQFGQWILSPRCEARSEASWAGLLDGELRLVRVDRVFRAGPVPLLDGEDVWWIIDFKTTHVDAMDPAAMLPQFRALFAPQLEIYAAVLRNLHGADSQIRAGLYYPRMSLLDWWEV